jgi:hypothetical protein
LLAAMTRSAPSPRGALRVAIAAATGLALALTSIGAWYRWRRASHVDAALGPPPLVLGSIVRPPIDAAPADAAIVVGTAPTIVDAAPLRAADTVVITRRQHRPVDTSEVTNDLGSGSNTIDVNTTVSP